jgi:hypothetical protein
MKPVNPIRRAPRSQGRLTRALGLGALLFYALLATVAQASTVLISDTTLVSGNESTVFSFSAPGPGTVSVELTNLDWPQPLSSLSFMAAAPDHVLSSWSGASASSFQVTAGGNYFADVSAVAGGPLDLGVYSLSLTFTPAASPVPLPSSGALLLGAIAGIIGRHLWRRRALSGRSGARGVSSAP